MKCLSTFLKRAWLYCIPVCTVQYICRSRYIGIQVQKRRIDISYWGKFHNYRKEFLFFDIICTVKKLLSLNLLFSCVFCIGRKTVHVGAEKIVTLYQEQVYVELENFSFTFNEAEDYAASEKWQKIFILILIIDSVVSISVAQWQSTWLGSRRLLDRSPPVLFIFLKAWRVKRKITFMPFLSGTLRHIYVTPERKLTPHRELHLWPPLYRT